MVPNKKIINAWCTYDLANSVYNLVITATIFPIYYNAITTVKDAQGNIISDTVSFLGFQFKNTALYDFALSFAFLLIATIIPLLSGVADYGKSKKRFMKFFTYLGALGCASMFFFTKDNLYLGIITAIVACIGYSGSLVFYNAYLPEIAPSNKQDAVSAKGFAMGYIGSSVLLIISLMMVQKPEWFGIASTAMATRITFLIVGLWWFGFSQIPFYYLPNETKRREKKERYLIKGYMELQKVWQELKHNKRLKRYLPAFFIYNMGVQTVMLVANHFGANEIKMNTAELITTILIIQFVAMLGSFLFSYLSRLIGNLPTLSIATLIWVCICIFTYFFCYTPFDFYIIAACVGLVMGGIQSLSRSTYSKMLPETNDPTSYFSFYDVCDKLGYVFGMLTFGIITQLTDTMRKPVISLIVFFIVGFILLFRVPKEN